MAEKRFKTRKQPDVVRQDLQANADLGIYINPLTDFGFKYDIHRITQVQKRTC